MLLGGEFVFVFVSEARWRKNVLFQLYETILNMLTCSIEPQCHPMLEFPHMNVLGIVFLLLDLPFFLKIWINQLLAKSKL